MVKPSTAKAKGRDTENLWVEWLRSHGWPDAERRRLNSNTDLGDIAGVPDTTIEVKSAATWLPVQGLRELDAEMVNTGDRHGYVIARPKGKPDPDDWVVMMRPAHLLKLLER